MHSQTLALHPNALVWRLGASPVALLAYLSLYWFASDFGSVDQSSTRPQTAQSVVSVPPPSSDVAQTLAPQSNNRVSLSARYGCIAALLMAW